MLCCTVYQVKCVQFRRLRNSVHPPASVIMPDSYTLRSRQLTYYIKSIWKVWTLRSKGRTEAATDPVLAACAHNIRRTAPHRHAAPTPTAKLLFLLFDSLFLSPLLRFYAQPFTCWRLTDRAIVRMLHAVALATVKMAAAQEDNWWDKDQPQSSNVRASHLLVKHSGSRNPKSWKDPVRSTPHSRPAASPLTSSVRE